MIGFDVWTYLRKAYLRPLRVVLVMAAWLVLYRRFMPADAGALLRLGGIALTFVVACAAVWGFGMFSWERQSVMSAIREKLGK